jgi:hypothetical protein
MIMDCIISTNSHRFSNADYVAAIGTVGDLSTVPFKVGTAAKLEILSAGTNDSFVLSSNSGTPIRLFDLGHRRYVLKHPIIVRLKQEDEGEYVVSFPEAELSRSGETPRVALEWLKSSIVDLYELYKKREDQLGPLPKRQLRALENCLVAKSHFKSRSNIYRKKTQSGNRSRRAA